MKKVYKKFGILCMSVIMACMLVLPCFAKETDNNIIRVGSFEDTFNYMDKNGVRRGYGYELMQALAGYTGWQFEYVKCDWSNCFEKLENGEIDIMGDISYTDERAQQMLFSEESMADEKYILYADLTNTDIVTSDFKSLDGKRVGVLMGTEPENMLTEWENKYGIHTEHVNVCNNEDVKKKLENHEIDCFVSLEESIWSQRGISSVTAIGQSGIYFVMNKERSDIKQELDYAMRQLDQDSPFFKADLYKKYLILGGMPSIIKDFINKNMKITEVNFDIQEQIITSYLADMNKYTENSEGIKNSKIYNSIPKELARENNTFKYNWWTR